VAIAEQVLSKKSGRYDLFTPSETLTFILTSDKTLVSTRYQTFLIRYDHRNYIKQLERLRELIRKGKMTSIVDLITYCKYRPGGYKDQMCGLELVPTRLERHI
jgi:hypothetical protein